MNSETLSEREYEIAYIRPGSDDMHLYVRCTSIQDAQAEVKRMREQQQYEECEIRIAEIVTTVRWITTHQAKKMPSPPCRTH